MLLLYFLITASAAYTRFRHIQDFPIYTDEDFHNGRLLHLPSTVQAASWLQQPPIHYFFTKFTLFFLSASSFSIRLFPAIFSTAAAPLFFSLLLKTCEKKWIAFFATMLFVSHPWIISNANEGKPYSCGIFFFLLFLHALYDSVTSPRKKYSHITLLTAATLFLLSIGLQPALLILTLISSILFYCNKKQKILQTVYAMIGALLIFAPFEWNILQQPFTDPFVKFFDYHNFLLTIPKNIRTFSQINKSLFPVLLYIAPFTLFTALATMIFCKNINPENKKNEFKELIILNAILYPIVFFGIFFLFVNYYLFERYFLLYVPLCIAATMYCFEATGKWITALFRNNKILKYLYFLIIFSTCVAAFTANTMNQNKKILEIKWRDFFHYLDNENVKNSIAHMFSLNQPQNFVIPGWPGFLTTDFYYNKKIKKKIILTAIWEVPANKDEISLILEQIENKLEPDYIYFFNPYAVSEKKITEYNYPKNLKFSTIFFQDNPIENSAMVLKIKNVKGFLKTLELFYLAIDKQESSDKIKIKVFEILSGIYIQSHKCELAQYYLDRAIKTTPKELFVDKININYLEKKYQKHCTF